VGDSDPFMSSFLGMRHPAQRYDLWKHPTHFLPVLVDVDPQLLTELRKLGQKEA